MKKVVVEISNWLYFAIQEHREPIYSQSLGDAVRDGTLLQKGKWIEYEVDVAPHPLHCSLCGFSNHHISNRYMREFRRCPNCGAEMNGGGEDDRIGDY